jgi:hypothetical protein
LVVPFCKTDAPESGTPFSSLTIPVICRDWDNAQNGMDINSSIHADSSVFFIKANVDFYWSYLAISILTSSLHIESCKNLQKFRIVSISNGSYQKN